MKNDFFEMLPNTVPKNPMLRFDVNQIELGFMPD